MLGLKLIHVSKSGTWVYFTPLMICYGNSDDDNNNNDDDDDDDDNNNIIIITMT